MAALAKPRLDEKGTPAHHPDVARFIELNEPGCQLIELALPQEQMAAEVARGLAVPGQRSLPSTYFYDRAGSLLYEQITELPEYYQTRTEAAILRTIAPELCKRLGNVQLVELGSGSSEKTRILLSTWQRKFSTFQYVPIDVSETMLRNTARGLADEYPGLQVLALCGDYFEAMEALPADGNRLVLFLGGTIGNFTPDYQARFFERLASVMQPGARLLVGFDLAPHAGKSEDVIIQAYNDAAGITAQFNLNMLTHLNTRLGADFELSQWRHQAVYNREANQIEMVLISQKAQTVTIPALSQRYRFEENERILTEISRRFEPDALGDWFEGYGFREVTHWTDPARYFALMLLEAV